MKLLYATNNPAKVAAMQNRIRELGIELIGFSDLNRQIPEVAENGSTPLENASKRPWNTTGYLGCRSFPVIPVYTWKGYRTTCSREFM